MRQQSPNVFAFECSVRGSSGSTIINAASRSKARYRYLLDVSDCLPDITFADIQVRKVGGPHTSEAFLRNAVYRGMPGMRCGTRVTVNGRPGTVVGHNESANFEVLFGDGCDWAGAVLNVHPGDIRPAPTQP